MILNTSICFLLSVILSASALPSKDLKNLINVNLVHPEQSFELIRETVRKQLRGEDDVCQIFNEFLQNPQEIEKFENHTDWLLSSK